MNWYNDKKFNERILDDVMKLLVVAVLELDSHPDHKKGPDHAPCAGP